jgi:hypothetical protein
MIRIHFDLLWTVIADTLYFSFSHDLQRFEHERANTIFKRFINMPGKVSYDGNEFDIKIRKKAYTYSHKNSSSNRRNLCPLVK